MRFDGAVVATALALALGGCVPSTGDFGRPLPSYMNDSVLPLVGREMARIRGEPVSYYMLTDAEKELRARSYRLVMPIHRRAFLARSEAELVRARVWPDSFYGVDASLYYRKLRGDGFESTAARYNAIESEILADILLIEPYYAVVRRICADDARRMAALAQTVALTGSEEADAIGRVHENRRVIDWALTGLRWRLESYAYALQRSRIEIPSKNAVSVELALARLASEIETLSHAVSWLECVPASLRSVVVGADGAPLVVKG